MWAFYLAAGLAGTGHPFIFLTSMIHNQGGAWPVSKLDRRPARLTIEALLFGQCFVNMAKRLLACLAPQMVEAILAGLLCAGVDVAGLTATGVVPPLRSNHVAAMLPMNA